MKRLALLLLAALVPACQRGAEPTVVRANGLEIRAAVDPATARVGDNRLEIELRDAEGRPVENAALDVKVHMHAMGAMAAMGGHAHVAELGEGRYQAHFELGMGGSWQLELAATPPSGPTARAEGSLTVGTPGLRLEAVGGAAPEGHGQEPAVASEGHVHGAAPAPTGASAEFRFAPERLRSIGVRTVRAERRTLTPSLRTTGRVAWDETLLHDVSLKVRGWVGELHVDAVGDLVERGEVMFTLYSPELYAAQREYLLARDAQARNRLRLWDLAPADLGRVEAAGAPLEFLPIRSPARGYVMEKDVVAGAAVEAGQRLYRIAPLDPVWIEAEIYEQDIPLVTQGMRAVVEVPALPGRRFEGRVAWVYPSVSERTRTARVRFELPNPDLALRPDMFANLELEAAPHERLVVPLSAVLYAGERSFVFLELGGGRLRPQPVEVGMRAGEDVEILAGVEAGQAVVSSATFLVASESRLRAALDQW
jgi:Cu(I)/Ag(I) efflux system membrane fusion protein